MDNENLENSSLSDEEILKYMREALIECQSSLEKDEVPVGCIFLHFQTKQIIARGHNLTNKTKNATTHAEINCINNIYDIFSDQDSKNQFISKYNLHEKDIDEILSNCVLFVSCEPCIMCAYALNIISKHN